MFCIPKVKFTMRELNRLKRIQGLIEGQLKQHPVSNRLGLTTRRNLQLKSAVADHALGIPRSTYADFGVTLAAEEPRERHGVDLAVETVRSLMVAGGLQLPRPRRVPKIQ